jgi:hypothetical protein
MHHPVPSRFDWSQVVELVAVVVVTTSVASIIKQYTTINKFPFPVESQVHLHYYKLL